MYDGGDGPEAFSSVTRKARKAHRCCECNRTIQPGETYRYESGIWDGEANSYKTCAHCSVASDWLNDECGGFMYGGVLEDIEEHGPRVQALASGMRCKWESEGGLLPIPERPALTPRSRYL